MHAVVAQEAEFRIDGVDSSVDSDTPELFFCHDLDGYGWCVRKGDYLNIGLGRRGSEGFLRHQRDFMTFLERTRKAPNASFVRWKGHAYLASGAGVRPLVDDGVMLIGDAAGLAYPESGEGIRPAIEAGRLAAETLVSAESDVTPAIVSCRTTAAMRRLHPLVRPGRQSTRRVDDRPRARAASLASFCPPRCARSLVPQVRLSQLAFKADGRIEELCRRTHQFEGRQPGR